MHRQGLNYLITDAQKPIAIKASLLYTPAIRGFGNKMVKPLAKRTQCEAFRIVFWQLALVVMLAGFALTLYGFTSAFSVLAGGCAYVFANLVFVWRVFVYAGAQQMTKFAIAFFIGEMLKLLLSAILFLMIVKYLPISLLSVLVGFIGAIVAFWVACLFLYGKT